MSTQRESKSPAAVSVIVPVFNLQSHISGCVDSLLAQTYADFQIVLVNDGSTDGSGRICDELAANNQRILVVHKENGGLSSARNAGLRVVESEYVVFVDGDDVVSKYFLDALITPVRAENCQVSAVNLQRVANQDSFKEPLSTTLEANVLGREEALKEVLLSRALTVSACGKLAAASLWRSFPFPDGRVYEDLATTTKVIAAASSVGVIPEGLYGQVERPGSITRSKVVTSRQYLDYKEAIDDCLSSFSPDESVRFERYLRAREMMETIRMLRLWTEVEEPTAAASQLHRDLRSLFSKNWVRVVFGIGYETSLRAKVLIWRLSPSLFDQLFKAQQQRHARVRK